MASAKERENFLTLLVREYPTKSVMEVTRFGRALLRLARTHGNLAEEECNGPGDYVDRIPYPRAGEIIAEWEAKLDRCQAALDKRIGELCAGFGVEVNLGGDPRGYTVGLRLPSKAYNTMGGSEDGYGVPQ